MRQASRILEGMQTGGPLPAERWAALAVPTLVIDGGDSPHFTDAEPVRRSAAYGRASPTAPRTAPGAFRPPGGGLAGRSLSFAEREEIALGRAAGESVRSIARRLGRSPSTLSRELRRSGGGC
jgi:Helix-turn-helix domain